MWKFAFGFTVILLAMFVILDSLSPRCPYHAHTLKVKALSTRLL